MDPTFGTMKVLLLLFVSASLAFAQDCPDVAPVECGADDMQCYGGKDNYGCQMPDFCTPMKGGNETYLQKYNIK